MTKHLQFAIDHGQNFINANDVSIINLTKYEALKEVAEIKEAIEWADNETWLEDDILKIVCQLKEDYKNLNTLVDNINLKLTA